MTIEIANQILKKCQDNHDIIVDVFQSMCGIEMTWPEKNLYEGDWSAVPLRYNYNFIYNTKIDDLLENTSIAMFSILRSGTEIKKHRGHLGYCEHIIRCHYCIQNSENNVLVVENIPYIWKSGEGFYFDDAKEHWGWNRGTKDRVVLLFDVPMDPKSKPEMTLKMKKRFDSIIS